MGWRWLLAVILTGCSGSGTALEERADGDTAEAAVAALCSRFAGAVYIARTAEALSGGFDVVSGADDPMQSELCLWKTQLDALASSGYQGLSTNVESAFRTASYLINLVILEVDRSPEHAFGVFTFDSSKQAHVLQSIGVEQYLQFATTYHLSYVLTRPSNLIPYAPGAVRRSGHAAVIVAAKKALAANVPLELEAMPSAASFFRDTLGLTREVGVPDQQLIKFSASVDKCRELVEAWDARSAEC